MTPASFGVSKPVVANLLMLVLLASGLIFGLGLNREFFPEVRPNLVSVAAPYPGASPDEVEQSLAIKIEDRLIDLDDIEEVRSTVTEGAALVMIEFKEGVPIDDAVARVKREVDALQDLPEQAERMVVTEIEPNLPVIVLSLYGSSDEHAAKRAIREIADDLRLVPGMGQVQVTGTRTDEIRVEVSPDKLLQHGISIADVGRRVRGAMIELPSGSIRTGTQSVSVRTVGADERADEVRRIVVKANPDGTVVRVEDIATVEQTFVDIDLITRLNGEPAVSLTVFKVGRDEDIVSMAELVKTYAAGLRGEAFRASWGERAMLTMRDPLEAPAVSDRHEAWKLGMQRYLVAPPPGQVRLTTDLARFVVGRMELLTRNALWGGALVFLTLVLLLNRRVSFWVAMGLVISISGTLAAMHFLGVTLNLLTMFGLIVVIGLLVDDAIVVAENITTRHESGEPSLLAAVRGTNEVSWPVVATVLTTICAFLPFALIEGQMGDFMAALPTVVTIALGVSLFEALVILPSHMSHSLERNDRAKSSTGWRHRAERRLDDWRAAMFARGIVPLYSKTLRTALRMPYTSVCVAIALTVMSLGLVAGGVVPFTFFEDTDSETVNIELQMPVGTPVTETDRVIRRIEASAMRQPEIDSAFSIVGLFSSLEEPGASAQQTHLGQIILELHPVEKRERTSLEVEDSIREEIGELPGIKRLRFENVGAGPEGPPITLTIAGDDLPRMLPVVARVEELLGEYDGVFGIANDADAGQRELRIELLDSGRALGFTTASLAEQVRGFLYGIEAHTFAGDREDVDVRVTVPEAVRRSLASIEDLHVFSPTGAPVPLREVADLTEATGYATIRRLDRQRVITITAELDNAVTSPEELMRELRPQLAQIAAGAPGVRILERGRQKEFADSMSSLPLGMLVAAGLIYVVLAWLFQSYFQPLLVMSAIPFATIGMIWGHLALGFQMTFLSLVGFVALMGIVVNDSLIFMEFFNAKRREGLSTVDACYEAGRARVRAIMLTTITTVLGLMPLMLEQSFQARFLIPMAVTISCGLISATAIILIILPCMLVILRDARAVARLLWTGRWEPDTTVHTAGQELAKELQGG